MPKSDHSMSAFSLLRSLWSTIQPFRSAIGFWAALLLLSALFESVGIASFVPVLQLVLGEHDGRLLSFLQPWLAPIPSRYQPLFLAAVAVSLVAAKQLLSLATAAQASRVTNRIRDFWRHRVMHHYLYNADPFSPECTQGVLLENVIQQPMLATQLVRQILAVVRSGTYSIALVVMLLVLNWKLTLLTMGFFAAIMMLGHFPLKRYGDRLARRNVQLLQAINSMGIENITSVKTVRQFSQEKPRLKKFTSLSGKQGQIVVKYAIIKELPNVIGTLSIAAILLLGVAYLTLINSQGAGALVAIAIVFAYVSTRLNNYAATLSRSIIQIRQALPSYELIEDIFHKSAHSLHESGIDIGPLRSDIVITDLHFSYGSTENALNGVTLRIPLGRISCIAGPSGSGKSTIGHILAGQIRAPRGSVKINGRDFSTADLARWRKAVATVSQDPFLFNGSVRENIMVGKQAASIEEVEAAAKIAQAHHFIVERLEDGYNTFIGDGGANLSGGQRQRIAIARAVIRDSDLYVFDEATNALDSESRDAVIEAMKALKRRGKTIVVIAHDKDVCAQADVVLNIASASMNVALANG